MDKLTCMRAFVAVVDAGSFSEAARRMGLSKALVSKYVGQLEVDLDLRLLHRTTRRVSVTGDGQIYVERVRPLLAELEELEQAMRSEHLRPRGELRVTAPTSFAELHLMPVVSRFVKRWPEVTVRLELTDRFVDLVEEGVDLGIRIGELTESSLVARRLAETSMVVCAAPRYLQRHGEPTGPQQLTGHTCIVDPNYTGGARWTVGQGGNAVTVDVRGNLNVNSARAVRELLLDGLGVGCVPYFAVEEDIAAGRLTRLFPGIPLQQYGIYAVYPHRKHLASKVRLFVDAAAEHFAQKENCWATRVP